MHGPNIQLIDALLTACGHTPLRNIKQHYDAEQGCWCVRGEVESMISDTNLRSAHIQIGNHTFKITWEVSASPGSEPRIIECDLTQRSGHLWDFEVASLADRFDDLAKSMRESIKKEPTDD